MQPPSTGIDAFGAYLPRNIRDMHRGKKLLFQIIQQGHASHLLYDGRKHIGTHRIIFKLPARSLYRFGKEGTYPVGSEVAHIPVGSDARCQGKQVADSHVCQISGNRIRKKLREKGTDAVCQAQAVVRNGKPHGSPDKGFGTGIHGMAIFRRERSRINFSDDLAVTQHHHAVDICSRQCHQGVKQGSDSLGRDSFRLGCGTWQLIDLRMNCQRSQQAEKREEETYSIFHNYPRYLFYMRCKCTAFGHERQIT